MHDHTPRLTEAATTHVPVTPLDPRRTALRADGNLYIHPDVALRVSNEFSDALGIRLGDLADRTQWMRDWAWGEHTPSDAHVMEDYLGDGHYLGERWMVYAHITRSTRVIRYIAYPCHNSDGSPVAHHEAVEL